MNDEKKGVKMRRWELKVGWTSRLTLEYDYNELPDAGQMAFELAERTEEPVTIRLIEEAETEDDIPVE